MKKQFLNNMNPLPASDQHKYLCYTNLLLVISILYFLCNIKHLKTNKIIESVLAFFLVVTIILSQRFWTNPIKGSLVHRIDAMNAKVVILSCSLYTLIYKFSFQFCFILCLIVASAYFSNYYSMQEWCCNRHLCCHGLMHIFCFFALFYTFSPIRETVTS